jgi:hypothetical protein
LQELIAEVEGPELWEDLVEEIAVLEELRAALEKSDAPGAKMELSFLKKKLAGKQRLLAAIDMG